MLREHFTMIWMNKESMNRSFGNLWMQIPECLIHRWIWQKIFSQKDVVHFCASQNFAVIWVWNHPGRHRTVLHMEPSKLYPCHYKTSFVLTRVTCRLPCSGAMCIAVSLRERGVRESEQLKSRHMKNQRTKVFQLRLTSDELLNLKEKAVPYPVSYTHLTLPTILLV